MSAVVLFIGSFLNCSSHSAITFDEVCISLSHSRTGWVTFYWTLFLEAYLWKRDIFILHLLKPSGLESCNIQQINITDVV